MVLRIHCSLQQISGESVNQSVKCRPEAYHGRDLSNTCQHAPQNSQIPSDYMCYHTNLTKSSPGLDKILKFLLHYFRTLRWVCIQTWTD